MEMGIVCGKRKKKFYIEGMDRGIQKDVNKNPFVPTHKVNGIV